MNFGDLILRNDEKAIFTLRSLYREYGYSLFKMNKFEEYDLYVKNKDFLISDSIITFTDTNGKLMALKPDVTLSIIKNTEDAPGVRKLYYNENVYRVSDSANAFKEIMQVGLECIGDVDSACISEVLMLAVESLKCISRNAVLDVSHMGIIYEILDKCQASFECRKQVLKCIGEKNMHELDKICMAQGFSDEMLELLKRIAMCRGKARQVLPMLRECLAGIVSGETVDELEKAVCGLDGENVNIDFSVVNDMNYYSGIVFKGFVSELPSSVLSGGQYDKLMKKMGRSASAVGFAVYLDMLERVDESAGGENPDTTLNIALPKGRLGERVYEMFEKAGFPCPAIKETNRKLIFENEEIGVRYFWVKPSDVAIYVERGAADIGVAGKDILLEYEPDVYELLDLNTGKCRMAVAAPEGYKDDPQKTLRVATKFAKIARSYYASMGRDIDIIHLNGSIEIAPILGLSDVIVDIVETGTTLKENKLEVIETVVPISARLIANKASSKFNGEKIKRVVAGMAAQLEAEK